MAASEAGPYLTAGSDLGARLADRADGTLPPLSLSARDLVLDDCAALADPLQILLVPPTDVDDDLAWCRGRAAADAEATPAFGYAWYVSARLAAQAGDDATFLSALARSYDTAPTEQWIAERRVALAEGHLTSLSPALLADHEHDLALLVQSPRGVASIARRYIADPSFRDRIAAIVATLPNDDQARFVGTIQHQVSESSTD